jgi:flagellar protein FliO/FliZ
LGGEKLNRLRIFIIVVLIAAGCALHPAGFPFFSAQELDAGEAMSAGETAPSEVLLLLDEPSPESLIILGEAIPGAAITGGPSAGTVIRMVLVLALSAAAVYGVVFFLRRTARPQESRNPHLKILTSAHLGSNRFVYVVAVGSRAWLLGAGEGGVTPIAELTDQEVVDAMLLDDSRKQTESGGRLPDFRALLRRLGGPTGGGQGLSNIDKIRKNRNRIKGL